MGSEVKFSDADNLERQSRIQLISSKYRFDKDYDPPEWDPVDDDDFELDETVVVYGQRRQGKSYLVRYLLMKLRKYYPIIYVFTATAFNNFWQQVVPADKVIEVDVDTPEGRESTLNEPCLKILELNAKRVSLWKRIKAETHKAEGNPLAIMVGDDIVTNETIRLCPGATKTMLNGRHHGLPSWVLTQVWVGLTPNQRKNLDRVILFSPTDQNVENWVLQTYGVHVLQMYRRVTSVKHQAFVIVNKSDVKGERFYKVKADKDWVDMMLSRHCVLGNSKLWGDTDIREQKKQYPAVDMAAKNTLRRQFDKTVGGTGEVQQEETDLYNVAPTPSVPAVTDKKTKDSFSFAGLWS